MLPDDWRHVSLSAQELVKEMLKLDATGVPRARLLKVRHLVLLQPPLLLVLLLAGLQQSLLRVAAVVVLQLLLLCLGVVC